MKNCKGIVLRARVNTYFKVYEYVEKPPIHRIVSSTSFTVSRKKSCLGCSECGPLWDQLNEINNDWPVQWEAVQDRGLYQLGIEIDSVDPYTGQPDEWFLKLTEVKDERG